MGFLLAFLALELSGQLLAGAPEERKLDPALKLLYRSQQAQLAEPAKAFAPAVGPTRTRVRAQTGLSSTAVRRQLVREQDAFGSLSGRSRRVQIVALVLRFEGDARTHVRPPLGCVQVLQNRRPICPMTL